MIELKIKHLSKLEKIFGQNKIHLMNSNLKVLFLSLEPV